MENFELKKPSNKMEMLIFQAFTAVYKHINSLEAFQDALKIQDPQIPYDELFQLAEKYIVVPEMRRQIALNPQVIARILEKRGANPLSLSLLYKLLMEFPVEVILRNPKMAELKDEQVRLKKELLEEAFIYPSNALSIYNAEEASEEVKILALQYLLGIPEEAEHWIEQDHLLPEITPGIITKLLAADESEDYQVKIILALVSVARNGLPHEILRPLLDTIYDKIDDVDIYLSFISLLHKKHPQETFDYVKDNLYRLEGNDADIATVMVFMVNSGYFEEDERYRIINHQLSYEEEDRHKELLCAAIRTSGDVKKMYDYYIANRSVRLSKEDKNFIISNLVDSKSCSDSFFCDLLKETYQSYIESGKTDMEIKKLWESLLKDAGSYRYSINPLNYAIKLIQYSEADPSNLSGNVEEVRSLYKQLTGRFSSFGSDKGKLIMHLFDDLWQKDKGNQYFSSDEFIEIKLKMMTGYELSEESFEKVIEQLDYSTHAPTLRTLASNQCLSRNMLDKLKTLYGHDQEMIINIYSNPRYNIDEDTVESLMDLSAFPPNAIFRVIRENTNLKIPDLLWIKIALSDNELLEEVVKCRNVPVSVLKVLSRFLNNEYYISYTRELLKSHLK
jgi:hypothetical protein